MDGSEIKKDSKDDCYKPLLKNAEKRICTEKEMRKRINERNY